MGEGSDAYLARMCPFHFAKSFAGEEDPDIEAGLLEELPGIFTLLVQALGRFLRRGRKYPALDPATVRQFGEHSDQVMRYLGQRTVRTERPEGTSRTDVFEDYRSWCMAEGRTPLGRNKLFDRIRSHGVLEFRWNNGAPRKFELRLVDPEHAGSRR